MMEANAFEALKKEIGSGEPESAISGTARLTRIRQQLASAIADGSLKIVDSDELALLAAYREWKQTSAAASGVFHYKR